MPAEGLEWLGRDEILTFEEIARLARGTGAPGRRRGATDRGRAARSARRPDARADARRNQRHPRPVIDDERRAARPPRSAARAGRPASGSTSPSTRSTTSASPRSRAATRSTRCCAGSRRPSVIRSSVRSRSTASPSKASRRRRCRRLRSSRAASRTSCASSSSCRSMPTRHGARTTCSRAREIRAIIEQHYGPLVEIPAKASSTARRFRFADGAGEIGFVNPVVGAVLLQLRPHPADGRRPAAHVPLLQARVGSEGAAPRRRERRRADGADPLGRPPQGAQAQDQRSRLRRGQADRCRKSGDSSATTETSRIRRS